MSEAQQQEKVVRNQAERMTRPKRGGFGATKLKMGVDYKVEGYHLYWMNDEPGRIAEALDYGYEHVTGVEVYSGGNSEKVKRLAGRTEGGEPLYAYLMKIRQDWYEEDQADQQAVVDEYDRAIRSGTNERVDNGYVPTAGIKMKRD